MRLEGGDLLEALIATHRGLFEKKRRAAPAKFGLSLADPSPIVSDMTIGWIHERGTRNLV